MSTEHDIGLRSEEPLEQQLRPALDEAGVARVWRGIRAQRVGEARTASASDGRRGARWAVAGMGTLAAVAALVVLARLQGGAPQQPGALRVAVGEAALSTVLRPSRAPIALDDGSRLVVAAGTDMEVLANDGARFVTLLRRGRCHFAVKPGGPRRWTIETDLATVEVVGTEFTVDRSALGLAVTVDHGVVLVRGERVPGRVTRLRAGERLDLPNDATVGAVPLAAPASTPPEVVQSAWVSAATGTAANAVRLPVNAPQPTAARAHASADDADARLAEADAARAAGRTEDAARVLGEVMRAYASDPRGALAAFSLAKLQLEALGRPGEAAETFAWVVRRGSPRGLVEDAQARRVEALTRAGRRAEAAAEARVYEARWPDGRRLAEVRAFVAE